MGALFKAGIIGTGSYIPDNIVTNKDLEEIIDTSDEWIVSRTGIRERRIADATMATSDMASIAAKRAIKKANLSPKEIELIIVATATPDNNIPSTACIVQENIGAVNAAAFDINAACSGFIYGLITADQFIASGIYRNILVIGAESLSKFTDWTDRNTCILFGDGAGATVVGRVDKEYGILSRYLGADGGGSDLLKIEAGGSRMPADLKTVEKRLHYIYMDGSEVFKFAVRIMTSASERAVTLAGLTNKDIDFLIPHQANIRIIEAARKRLKLDEDKVYVNLDRFGNMSAASIPVALDEAVESNIISKGDNIIMVGFGGGLTWASALMKWAY
ncbi:MAG: ketoacyl-ACP synthase III [Clostridiales bacterium]|nr:ketoacyl-ACP synthase III [Clostridiales bacterium]